MKRSAILMIFLLGTGLLIASMSGCSPRMTITGEENGRKRGYFNNDIEPYNQRMALYKAKKYEELLTRLREESEYYCESRHREPEGCFHVSGERMILELRLGQYDEYMKSRKTFMRCVDFLERCTRERCIFSLYDPEGREFRTWAKEIRKMNSSDDDLCDKEIKALYERRKKEAKLRGEEYKSIEGYSASSTISCRWGEKEPKVAEVSDYFSWTRPLEDFEIRGSKGSTSFPVFVSIVGTIALFELFTGYPHARKCATGSFRYERPDDWDMHVKGLIRAIEKEMTRLPRGETPFRIQKNWYESFHKTSLKSPVYPLDALQQALAQGNAEWLEEVVDFFEWNADDLMKIDIFARIDAAFPDKAAREQALSGIESLFFNRMYKDRTVENFELYSRHFAFHHRMGEIKDILDTLIMLKQAKKQGYEQVRRFYRKYVGTPEGSEAKAWLDEYVAKHIRVLEPGLSAAKGSRSWVNDWLESGKHIGTYGGEKYNFFLIGGVRNEGDRTFPVDVECQLRMQKSTSARILWSMAKSTEKHTFEEHYKVYLDPGETQLFMCAYENKGGDSGIGKGIWFNVNSRWDFADPPFEILPKFSPEPIAESRLRKQAEMVERVRTHGNLPIQASPLDIEKQKKFGDQNASTVHVEFRNIPDKGVEFFIMDSSGRRVYEDTVYMGILPTYVHLLPGSYTLGIPKLRLSTAFQVSGDTSSHVLDVDMKNGEVKIHH